MTTRDIACWELCGDSLYPRYRGGRPPTFTLPQRREMKKIAKSKPVEHGLPFRPGAWPVLRAETTMNSNTRHTGVWRELVHPNATGRIPTVPPSD
jgi:hypothetical protein